MAVIVSDSTVRGTAQRVRNSQFSVIANPGRFSRGVAISSLNRALSGLEHAPESEEIALAKKLLRDDTRLSFMVDTGVLPESVLVISSKKRNTITCQLNTVEG